MMHFAPDVRDAWLEATARKMNEGKESPRLVLIVGDRETGSVISDHEMKKPCGRMVAGEYVFEPIASCEARTDGAPTWARIYSGRRRWVMDLQVGEEVALSQRHFTEGQTIEVLSGSLGTRNR